jgi:carboxypeptidase family protein
MQIHLSNSQWGARWLAALLLSAAGCGGGGGSHHAVTQLSGIVATIDTATPVVGAQVSVDGSAQQTLTTLRGSYFLASVDVGNGWHTARAQKQIGGQSWTGERAILFDPNIPIQNNLLITIGPATSKGTIRGHVTDASGNALQNVSVFLNPGTSVAAAFRITDSGGRYEFDNVPAGTYAVVASALDLVNSATSPVAVAPGATATVDLTMLVSSGTGIAAPLNLAALAFTYPDAAAASIAQIRAVQRWLRGGGTRRVAPPSRRFRIQDWPAGSIIEAELSWSAPPANDLAGYVLDRAVGNGLFSTIDRFADPTATAYDDLDPTYTPDQTYRFRISAASTSGVQGSPSNVASMEPFAPLGGLSPANGVSVAGTPTFAWQAVPRAQQYQVLVLSRLPDVSDLNQMPLIWPPPNNLAAAQTTATQLAYGGPALQSGATYYWLVLASDQASFTAAQSMTASQVQSFTAR